MLLPDDLPLVRADATLVEQVIGNVVGNAVVHTPAESHVVVDATVTADVIALRVTDDGPGIPTDQLPRIFEKFVKGPEELSRRRRRKARGLALPSPRASWRRHGGSISAESPVEGGRGARFVMTFPREGAAA